MRVDCYGNGVVCGVGGEGEESVLVVGGGDAFGMPVEVGGERGVLRDDELSGIGGVAVVPTEESVGVVRNGGEGDGIPLEVGAAAVNVSADGIVGLCGDVVVVSVGEVGDEGSVLCDEDGTGVGGVAVVPPDEFVSSCRGSVNCLVDMLGQFTVGVGGAHGAVGREGVHHGVVDHGLEKAEFFIMPRINYP